MARKVSPKDATKTMLERARGVVADQAFPAGLLYLLPNNTTVRHDAQRRWFTFTFPGDHSSAKWGFSLDVGELVRAASPGEYLAMVMDRYRRRAGVKDNREKYLGANPAGVLMDPLGVLLDEAAPMPWAPETKAREELDKMARQTPRVPIEVLSLASGFWYLATPYTKLHHVVAYRNTCYTLGKLLSLGVAVFAPIAHTHGITDVMPEASDWPHDFWMSADQPMMKAAGGLLIAKLRGWDQSKGIMQEFDYFKLKGLPIWLFDPILWYFEKHDEKSDPFAKLRKAKS